MAGSAYTNQGWSEHEYSVFKLGNSFKTPFYVKTLSGFYSDDDSWCFSEGDIYVILLKIKIKSVIATVEGSFPQSQLKVPLDYDGKFYLVSRGNAGHDSGKTFTLRDIVSDKKLPQNVCLANPHFHRDAFLQRLKTHDCTLTLSEQTTDEYFMGKSPDGESVFLFSLEANMSFYVMKAAVDEVKYLLFNVGNLNYAIFIANVETPIVQCWPTKEAILSPAPPVPKRLPKASDPDASRTQPKKVPPPIPSKPSLKLGGKISHGPPLPPPRPPTVFPPNLARSNTRPITETEEFPPPPPHLLLCTNEDDHEAYNKQDVDTDEEYDRKTTRKPTTPPAPQYPLSALPIQFAIPPAKPPKQGGRSSHDRPLPPPRSPTAFSPNLVRSSRQAQADSICPIAEIEEPPPPPLPFRTDENDNDVYNKQLRLRQEVHTDEEYNKKAARKPTSPASKSPLTVLPIQLPVSPVKDYEGDYLTPIPSPKPIRTRLPPGFDPGVQSSSDSERSDYEEIDSDRSDYELVNEPTDDIPSPSSLTKAHSLSSLTSPSFKKRFDLKKNWKKLKRSMRKKPSFESGDIADDELTEDPYADHSFDSEKKPSKKRHPPQQRRRDDPLPMPVETDLPAPVKPKPLTPTASPSRSFVPPKLPPSRDDDSKDDIDNDDQSDYEQVDDAASSSTEKSAHFGLQSPSYITRHPSPTSELPAPLQNPSSTYAQNQTQPFRQHNDALPSPPSTVAMVVPLPKEPNVQEEFPRDLCNLSVEAIAQTLRKLKIPENVVGNFLEAQIDGQLFVCLDDGILDDLGVGSLHKLKIIKFKNGWRPNYQSN